MTTRARGPKMKNCPACGHKFISGKRALVRGKMVTVCRPCASGAVRVVSVTTMVKCARPKCNEHATTCSTCAAQAVTDATREPRKVAVIRAWLVGLAKVKQREGDDPSIAEYVRGKIEALNSALTLLEAKER